jgi:hypothetical protein
MGQRFDLLISDVDGTLVTQSKALTPRTVKAVKRMRAAGVQVAITSGRPPRGMRMLVEPLGIDSVIAGFNGGLYVKPDLTPISARTLPPETARRAIAAIDGTGIDAWLYSGEDWYVRDANAPHVAREAETVKFAPTVVDVFPDKALDSAAKVVGVSDNFSLVEKAESAAVQALGSTASVSRSQSYYLDVTPPEANKGAVVDTLSSMLSVPHERIAVIGDGLNDILMFRHAGFSIAMGNGSDAVKKAASVVTGSNDMDGFAEAIGRFILGDEGA